MFHDDPDSPQPSSNIAKTKPMKKMKGQQTKKGNVKQPSSKKVDLKKSSLRISSLYESSTEEERISYRESSDSPLYFEGNETKPPEDKDVECIFCCGLFLQDKKGITWVQCMICNDWCHVACSGTEKDIYKCEWCGEK